jgi:hypothetical protein
MRLHCMMLHQLLTVVTSRLIINSESGDYVGNACGLFEDPKPVFEFMIS